MRVVHFAEFSPHRCGLYHTTKDLVKAERGVGIDAHFVDVKMVDKVLTAGPAQTDGKLTTSEVGIADDADILVRHTIIPSNLENCGIPIVMALHGRPLSSLLLDERRENHVVQAIYNKGKDCRYKAFFTFWKEHLDFYGLILPPEKLHYVPAMVDLMDWRPDHRPFHFGEYNGKPNILIADIWREDVTPFHEIMAVRDFIKDHCPAARLHIIAAPTGKGANVFFKALRKEGVLGYVSAQTLQVKEFYAAADVVVSPHSIATRIARESLATGTPFIQATDLLDWYKTYQESPRKVMIAARALAEEKYNLRNAGLAIKKVFDGILGAKPSQRKVFIDLGGHLGQTVRRFYREVDDARFWEIFSFEPHPDCYRKLCENTKGFQNVDRTPCAVRGRRGDTCFFVGSANDGEGSTTVMGKTTGGVKYNETLSVPATDLSNIIIETKADIADKAVLKMNIEGGEYELMEHILADNQLKYFDQIYIQTHAHKLDPARHDEYRKLEEDFRKGCLVANVDLFMQDKGMAVFQCSQS